MLEREAEYLHSQFFKRPVAAIVVARYVAANQLCFPDLNEETCRILEAIVNRGLDAEAVELYLRLVRQNRVLTRKIQVLFYLVEVRADHYGEFVNQRPGLVHALLELFAAGIATVWKCIKGWYLVSTNGFV